MGLNISIYGPKNKEHPEWDSGRYAGDREIAALFSELPHETRNTTAVPDYEPEYRPLDFELWRRTVATREWPNPGRAEKLLTILEGNPDHWVYLGY